MDKKMFQALSDLSEVVCGLVFLDNNYSSKLSDKLDKALISINRCLPEEVESETKTDH